MKTPLYGHTSEATSFLQDDYPYGRQLRCKRRCWIEYREGKGYRFMAQTQDPRNGRWNKPHASTYSRMAGCMYLDEINHLHWDSLTEYDKPGIFLEFITNFPGTDMQVVRAFSSLKVPYLNRLLASTDPSKSPTDLARWQEELHVWQKVVATLPPKD